MKLWNRSASNVSVVLLYAIFGVIMLIWPSFLLNFVNYILATILCAFGVGSIVRYFHTSVDLGAPGFRLGLGLLLLLIGAVLFAKPYILQSILPFIWGLVLLIGGFGKVQMSVDLKRIGDRTWWTIMLGAAISLVLGALCLLRPGTIATMFTMFIGVSLLVEALLDAIALLVMRKRYHQAYPDSSGEVR